MIKWWSRALLSRPGRFHLKFHQLTIYFLWVWLLSGSFASHFFSQTVFMSLQGAASGNCVLWYSLLQANQVLPLSVPFAQMFSIVACCLHLLEQRFSQSLSYLLKLLCQSDVFMLGSGNFFECVTEGYDNYPFSISTVDMFIVLNVHHLCFALWKSLQCVSFDMHVRNRDPELPKHSGLLLDVKLIRRGFWFHFYSTYVQFVSSL